MAAGWWAATFATIATRMRQLSTALPGRVTDYGTIAASLNKPKTQILGSGTWSLGFATSLKKLATTVTGKQTQSGTIAAALKKLTVSTTGKQTQTGSVATALKKLTTSITAAILRVLYDATGAGGNNFSTSMTWNHTVAAGPAYVIVDVECSQASTATATCGGTNMTQLAAITVNGTCTAFRFGLSGVSAGTKAIVVTPGANTEMAGNSVSYSAVVSVGSTTTTTGTGTNPSQSATCGVGELIAQAFSAYNSGASGVTLSSPTGGTSRYNQAGSGRTAVEFSDSSTSATFGLTINASRPWAGIATVLKPV